MCRGDNTTVIQTLQGLPQTKTFGVEINFGLIMNVIQDTDLRSSHPSIVAAFVELLKGKQYCFYDNYITVLVNAVMFIEVGENRPFLEKFPFAFVRKLSVIL